MKRRWPVLLLVLIVLVVLSACGGGKKLPPTLEVSISPSTLSYGDEAKIDVHVHNPVQGKDLTNRKVVVGYAPENSDGYTIIRELPLSLKPGDDYRKTVKWTIDALPTTGKNFRLYLLLFNGDQLEDKASVPFSFNFAELTPTPTPVPPSLSVDVASTKLLYGADVELKFQVKSFPGSKPMKGYSVDVGYRPAGGSSAYSIANIPLDLQPGRTFEKEVTWSPEEPPKQKDYEVVVTLLDDTDSVIAQVAKKVEFLKPQISLVITPTKLTYDTKAIIDVKVANPSDVDLKGTSVYIGYGLVGSQDMYLIKEIPVEVPAGKTIEKKITWKVEGIPEEEGNYKLEAELLKSGSLVLVTKSTPITFIK